MNALSSGTQARLMASQHEMQCARCKERYEKSETIVIKQRILTDLFETDECVSSNDVAESLMKDHLCVMTAMNQVYNDQTHLFGLRINFRPGSIELTADGRTFYENPLMQMASTGISEADFRQIFSEAFCERVVREKWVEIVRLNEKPVPFLIFGKNGDSGEILYEAAIRLAHKHPLSENLKQQMLEAKLAARGSMLRILQIYKKASFPRDQNVVNRLWLWLSKKQLELNFHAPFAQCASSSEETQL